MDKLIIGSVILSILFLIVFVVLAMTRSQVGTNKAERIAAMASQSDLIRNNKSERVSVMNVQSDLIRNNKSERVSEMEEQMIDNCVIGFKLDESQRIGNMWKTEKTGTNTQFGNALYNYSWANSLKIYKPGRTWDTTSVTNYCKAGYLHDPGTNKSGVFFIGNKSTCVGMGSASVPCDTTKLVCAGVAELEGKFGFGSQQVIEFWKAADNGGVHPDCPDKVGNALRKK